MRELLLGVAVLVATPSLASADPQATVELVNVNAPNVGLNDPTPVAPVGGNPGSTLGAQRLFALQHAANIWARNLKSHVPIRMQVSFDVRACTATGAVLASAGALVVNNNFKRGELADTWYHGALANAVAKTDLEPAADDLRAIFNVNLGAASCLAGSPFYLGVDGNQGTAIDIVAVALHEFAHGMGFSQFASVTTGALFAGLPDVYNSNLLDLSTGKRWPQMTDGERRASAINSRKVVWTGAGVTAAVPTTLALGVPSLTVNTPAAIAGSYELGAASFGPALTSPGVTGSVVLARDDAGPSSTDGCSPIVTDVVGRIALVDRGTCGFTVKVKNAQNAGAIAVIVADNAVGSPPAGLGGVDPTITIPSGRITITDGNTLKAQLGAGVSATLGLDMTRRAGASTTGQAFLNAPNPVVPGSSISHWDPVASPNLLMEPAINADLTHGLDLTKPLFEDIGWQVDKSQGNGL